MAIQTVDGASEVTVVLADDHVIVRDGIRMVLESEKDTRVVAEAGTAEDAIRYVQGHKPSVLTLDLTNRLAIGQETPADPDNEKR